MTHFLRTRWQPILVNLWVWLTEPSVSITRLQDRRRARLLSAWLSLTVLLLLLARLIFMLAQSPESAFNVVTGWINIIIFVAAYGLSRTRHFWWATVVAVSMVSVIVFLQVVYQAVDTGGDLTNPAVWLAVVLLLSSLVIPWRATLLLSVGMLAGLLMLPLVIPGIRLTDVSYAVQLTFSVGLIIAVTSYLRQRDLDRIDVQNGALVENEGRYRALFAAAFEGIVIHDDGLVVDCNDAMLIMFGRSREEMIGMKVLDFIPEKWHTTVFQMAEDNIMTYEIEGRHKDGPIFDIEVSVKRLMHNGRLLRVVAMRDITERKKAEAERLQYISEHERAQVLRQFISDASHDLRQPLATMNTSLYLLRRKLTDPALAMRHIDTMDIQVAHLTRMLEDLFAMSRLDEPELYMERTPLEVNQLVERVVQEQQTMAAQKGHVLRFEPSGMLPPVLADHVELKRALTHLIANALAYTQEGGHITVRTALNDPHVCIEVQDTGIGISPDDLPHIFERFYRADHARRTETGGSGLGLALVQKIIDHHSGTVEVQSLPGRGSTFRICLPLPSQSRAG
jgi:PAS domain S-box-containing protein